MITLKTQNLIKKYGGLEAVNSLSLSFRQGFITGIIGPNGSGKTTFLNLLNGLEKITSGIIVVGDKKITKIKADEIFYYGFARTFQKVQVYEQMTVFDNMYVAISPRKISQAITENKKNKNINLILKILDNFNLLEKKDDLAENLSFGQRRLLELARILVMDYKIYFFDEPFSGLHFSMVDIVKNTIKNLKEKNKTIILIEHNMAIIKDLCDYVYVLDGGELIADGRPDIVLKNDKVIAAYLGD